MVVGWVLVIHWLLTRGRAGAFLVVLLAREILSGGGSKARRPERLSIWGRATLAQYQSSGGR